MVETPQTLGESRLAIGRITPCSVKNFIKSATLLFVLLNPFFISVYLLDLIQEMAWTAFSAVLLKGAMISGAVFVTFALVGETIFTQVLQVRFASFLIFGGLIFIIVSLRYFFTGAEALRELRGNPDTVAGSIAMPFMIGPGTVSASVWAGHRLPAGLAIVAVLLPVAASVVAVVALKRVYDLIHQRREAIVTRYLDVIGRIMALVTGTIAVEMIFRGLETWNGQAS